MVQLFEAESTYSAAVRSLPGVGALVDFQNVRPCEALVTHGAAVGFLLCVNASVQLEVPEPTELVPAERAAVGLVCRLAACVPLQVRGGGEALATLAAEVAALGLDLDVAGLGKGLTALSAGVWSPWP